jgi:hypothetical protein
MNMGVPLIDERHDIVQPPPDVISEHAYIDRTDPVLKEVVDTIEFSISNTISWSLTGQVQLTFGAKGTASLQAQLQQSLANSLATSQKQSQAANPDRTNPILTPLISDQHFVDLPTTEDAPPGPCIFRRPRPALHHSMIQVHQPTNCLVSP